LLYENKTQLIISASVFLESFSLLKPTEMLLHVPVLNLILLTFNCAFALCFLVEVVVFWNKIRQRCILKDARRRVFASAVNAPHPSKLLAQKQSEFHRVRSSF